MGFFLCLARAIRSERRRAGAVEWWSGTGGERQPRSVTVPGRSDLRTHGAVGSAKVALRSPVAVARQPGPEADVILPTRSG